MYNNPVSKNVQITLKNVSRKIKFRVKLYRPSEKGWWSEDQMEPAKFKI